MDKTIEIHEICQLLAGNTPRKATPQLSMVKFTTKNKKDNNTPK